MGQQPARIDPYQLVTESILAHLDRGVVPWRCPWNRTVGRPRNFLSGREYKGINVLLLGLMQFPSPWWMTFRQVNQAKGSVRKGEHGTPIMKWGSHQKNEGDHAEEKKITYFLRSYRVFNAVQIEGIEFPSPEDGKLQKGGLEVTRAADIVAQMPYPPKIAEGRTTRAAYRPSTDTVQMPALARFSSPEDFHHTLFHELIHATGHASRLARKGVMETNSFREKTYSQEELVAEMGAAFLGMEAGIVRDQHEQSAAYLRSWLDALREQEHRRWILLAANQAGRAADYVLGRNGEGTSTTVQEQPFELISCGG